MHLPRRWWSRSLALVGLVVVLLVAAVGVDVLVLRGRIDRLDVTLPGGGDGATWLLVGSDARSDAPAGAGPFGTTADAPGDHADAVVAVHVAHGRTTAISVPRDLLLSAGDGSISRLALLLARPQDLVDGLCRTLHLPVDHLVVIGMDAFAGAVDDVGGVTVEIPSPVRDRGSGLDLPHAGRLRLDGAQALALVRSRHPETLVDGRWTPVDDVTGTGRRTTSVGEVFGALAGAVRTASGRPWTVQALAWTATGSLRTDAGTGVTDLLRLADSDLGDVAVRDLPVEPVPGATDGVGAQIGPDTLRTVADAGFPSDCSPR
ncbi:LCP family protein [Jatrophihabitans sp. YIM 134969]